MVFSGKKGIPLLYVYREGNQEDVQQVRNDSTTWAPVLQSISCEDDSPLQKLQIGALAFIGLQLRDAVSRFSGVTIAKVTSFPAHGSLVPVPTKRERERERETLVGSGHVAPEQN